MIYINDLHNAIFSSETFHFADDTHLLYFNDDLLSICTRVDRDLRSLQTWLKANKISLNSGKTEFLIFRHFRKNFPFTPFLKIGGKKIFQSSNIKYLGILIDSNLNWKAHTTSLSAKLARANGIISKLRHYVSTKTLVNIYCTMLYFILISNMAVNYGVLQITPHPSPFLFFKRKPYVS